MPNVTTLYTDHSLSYQDMEGWRHENEGKAGCTLANKDPGRRRGRRLGSHYHIIVKAGRPAANAGPEQAKVSLGDEEQELEGQIK